MAAYYYLIASLPGLKADCKMPFSYEDFLKLCESSVSSSVYEKLKNLTLLSKDGPLLNEWGTFNGRLTAEINNERKSRLGKNFVSCYEKDQLISKTVNAVFAAKNPLEAEQIMLAAQFEYLDSIVLMHYFDEYVLFGYAIKLKLLERKSSFVKEEGSEEFKRLFDGIQNQIMSI